MAFAYVRLSPDQAAQFAPLIKGPVLGLGRSCAIDQQAGAVLLDLGGKPSLDPAIGEPPGHYNLMWQGQTVAMAGNYRLEERADGYVRLVSLDISVPQGLADQAGQIKQLIQDGMTALFCGRQAGLSKVEVSFDRVSHE